MNFDRQVSLLLNEDINTPPLHMDDLSVDSVVASMQLDKLQNFPTDPEVLLITLGEVLGTLARARRQEVVSIAWKYGKLKRSDSKETALEVIRRHFTPATGGVAI